MNELRVEIGGSTRGFQTAIDEAVGISISADTRMAENQKRSAMQAADNYTSFWLNAIEKREAAEKAASERDIAKFKANLETKWALNAEMAAIAKGSGGYGSLPAQATEGKAGRRGAGTAGMIAGQIAMESASGGSLKEITKDAAVFSGSIGVSHFITKLLEGKVEGLKKLPHEIAEVIEGFAKWGIWLAKAGGVVALIIGAEEIIRASFAARSAANRSNESTGLLRGQDANLGAKLGLGADATHEQIVKRQKELMAAQDVASEKDAQAVLHKQTLVTLSKAQREQTESMVNAQTRLAMLLGDERDLKAEIAVAEKAHDEQTFLEKSKELLNKQKQIFDTTNALKREQNSKNKTPETAHRVISTHVDSLAALGGIGSNSAITSNPVLVTAQLQLQELRSLRTDIKSLPNIFAP